MGISERLVSGTEAFTNILSGTKKASGTHAVRCLGFFFGNVVGIFDNSDAFVCWTASLCPFGIFLS